MKEAFLWLYLGCTIAVVLAALTGCGGPVTTGFCTPIGYGMSVCSFQQH